MNETIQEIMFRHNINEEAAAEVAAKDTLRISHDVPEAALYGAVLATGVSDFLVDAVLDAYKTITRSAPCFQKRADAAIGLRNLLRDTMGLKSDAADRLWAKIFFDKHLDMPGA